MDEMMDVNQSLEAKLTAPVEYSDVDERSNALHGLTRSPRHLGSPNRRFSSSPPLADDAHVLASAARNVAPAAPFPVSILPSKHVYLAEKLTSSDDDTLVGLNHSGIVSRVFLLLIDFIAFYFIAGLSRTDSTSQSASTLPGALDQRKMSTGSVSGGSRIERHNSTGAGSVGGDTVCFLLF